MASRIFELVSIGIFYMLKTFCTMSDVAFQKMLPAIFSFLLQYFEPWALQQISGGLLGQETPYDILKKVPITTTHTVVVNIATPS